MCRSAGSACRASRRSRAASPFGYQRHSPPTAHAPAASPFHACDQSLVCRVPALRHVRDHDPLVNRVWNAAARR
eukprot:7387443-Prymnesium_polylepis.1